MVFGWRIRLLIILRFPFRKRLTPETVNSSISSRHSIVLMGVSGAGKSVVGKTLGESLGWPFLDADDFHPESNLAKMHAGTPLTDDDRKPWLERLNAELTSRHERNEPAILACSALRATYRQILQHGLPDLVFVHLQVDPETVLERVGHRAGHFFPTELVESQFQTLEPPSAGSALIIDATQPIAATVAQIRASIGADVELKKPGQT